MRALRTYDYAVVRVVPRVERGEFVNAGVILSCDVERILLARIELDENALLALDARVDLDLSGVCSRAFLRFAPAEKRREILAECRHASAFTGWLRREARSCKPRLCTRVNVPIPQGRWNT